LLWPSSRWALVLLGFNDINVEAMKAVLSVLVRSYVFELPNGPTTVIEKHPSILPRPRVVGQQGPKVPMKIRRVD